MAVIGEAFVEVSPTLSGTAVDELKAQLTTVADEATAANSAAFESIVTSADVAAKEVGLSMGEMAATATEAADSIIAADKAAADSATETATLTVDAQGKMRNARGQYATAAEVAAAQVSAADKTMTDSATTAAAAATTAAGGQEALALAAGKAAENSAGLYVDANNTIRTSTGKMVDDSGVYMSDFAAKAKNSAGLYVDAQGTIRNATGDAMEAIENETTRGGGFMAAFSGVVSKTFSGIGSAVGTFIPPLGKVFDDMGEKIATAETEVGGFGESLMSLSKVASVAGIAALGVVSLEAVKAATNFQSASEHLVTDAGEAQSNMAMIEQGMLRISASTGTSANDIVNGMYHIESAGQHGAAALTILGVAAEGAKVGNADLDTVSKTLVGTLNSLHDPASGATSLMNELIATVSAGDVRMEDLASSLGNVVPIAAKAGLSFAQIGGAIATMTSQNMSAQQATQDLANLIRGLEAPSQVAINEMAQLGLNSNTVSQQLGQKGLTGTLTEFTDAITAKMGPAGTVLLNAFNQSQGAAQDMQTEIAHMSPTLATMAKSFEDGKMTVQDWRTSIKALPADQQALAQGFVSTFDQANKFNQLLTSGSPAAQTFNAALEKMTGGATGLTTALMLSGGSMGTFTDNTKTIQDAADKTGKSVDNWSAIQGTLKQQLDVGQKSVEALGIQYGLFLIPYVEKAIGVFSSMVNWMTQHKDVALALAGVVGGVLLTALAAAAATTAIWAAEMVIATWPILAAVAAGALLAVGIDELVTHWHEITQAVEDFIDKNKLLAAVLALPFTPIIVTIGLVVAAIKYWGDITAAFSTAWNDIWAAAVDVIHALTGAWNDTWAAIAGAFNDTLGAISGAWNATIGGLADAWNSTWGAITGAYQAVYGVIAGITGEISDIFTGIAHVIATVVVGAFDIFRDTVTTTWDIIKGVFETIADAVTDVLSVPFEIFSKIVELSFVAAEDAILLAWIGIKAVFDAIYGVVSVELTNAFNFLWRDVIDPVWQGIYAAISASWSLISGVFDAIIDRVQNGLTNVFNFLWHGVIDPVWQGITAAISMAWAEVAAVFDAIVDRVVNGLEATFTFLWHGIIVPVWQGIYQAISSAWSLILGVFQTIETWVQTTLANAFNFLWHGVIQPAWEGIFQAISSAWGEIKGTFDTMIAFVKNDIPNAFTDSRNAISGVWGGIESDAKAAWATITNIFKTPINLIISGVNDLISGVNDISGLVGNKTHITPITPLASGGYITNGPALVGEGNPAFPEVVIATDPAFRTRNLELTKIAARAVGLPMLASGGIVGDITGGISTAIGDVTGAVSSAVSFVGGIASQAASLIESGSVDLVLDPIFAAANAIVGNVLPTIDPLKALENEIKSWVTGTVAQQIATMQSALGPTGGSGGYGSLTSWLGVPYLWGGGHGVSEAVARREGVDCSGLVDQVYGVQGTTFQQVKMGTAVPNLAASLPGDLAFFSSLAAGEDHHVGIIVVPGGTQMIDAPYTGTVVRYDSTAFDGGPSQIRRLMAAAVTPGAAGGTGDTAGAAGAITNTQQFATQLLADLGDPISQPSVASIMKWANAEGGMWHNTALYNPLNTTLKEPGSHPINSVGVQAYTSWDQGMGAVVATLRNGHYPEILNLLASGGGLTKAADANLDTWGTGSIFDQGGIVPPGVSTMVNNTGANEQLRVVSPDGAGIGNIGASADATTLLINAVMSNTAAISGLVTTEGNLGSVQTSMYNKLDDLINTMGQNSATMAALVSAMQTNTAATTSSSAADAGTSTTSTAAATVAGATPVDTSAAAQAAMLEAAQPAVMALSQSVAATIQSYLSYDVTPGAQTAPYPSQTAVGHYTGPGTFTQAGPLGALGLGSGAGTTASVGALAALGYDDGGVVPPGISLMFNGTGSNEQLRVVTPAGAGAGASHTTVAPGAVVITNHFEAGATVDSSVLVAMQKAQEDTMMDTLEQIAAMVQAGNPGGRPN